jgi:hypothetical protein
MESKTQMEFAMLRSGLLPQQSQPQNQQSQLDQPSYSPKLVTLSELIEQFLEEKASGWSEKTGDEFPPFRVELTGQTF